MKEKVKIYDIGYLKDSELTEDDLHMLFDTDSLVRSLIVHMFNVAGYKYSKNDILDICTKRNWFDNYKISKKSKEVVLCDFTDVIKNVYVVSNEIAKKYANDLYMKYGLIVDKKLK